MNLNFSLAQRNVLQNSNHKANVCVLELHEEIEHIHCFLFSSLSNKNNLKSKYIDNITDNA